MLVKLKDIIYTVPDKKYQIKNSEIQSQGRFPVVDQSSTMSGFYDVDKCFDKGECILFADHTSRIFYMGQKFIIGCDGMKIIKIKDGLNINQKFIYFALCNNYQGDGKWRRHFGDFQNCTIDLPDRKTQDKIAEILSGIDEQINRNNEIVKRLQVLAQTTYSRWFNQFEFPNEDGLPYKSSSGKMVWNDELKREIPENWIIKSLGDLLSKNTEKLKNYNGIPTIDLSVMQTDNFALCELNISDNFATNLFVMHKGDLMFGSIRPYLHKAGIAPCDGAFAGTVHSYKPIDNIDYNVCLSVLISNDMFSFAVKNAKGTKMPVIASDDLLQYKIPYNESVSKQFTKLLDIKNVVCNCMMQNNILIQLKNNILPLLINGQLNV